MATEPRKQTTIKVKPSIGRKVKAAASLQGIPKEVWIENAFLAALGKSAARQ